MPFRVAQKRPEWLGRERFGAVWPVNGSKNHVQLWHGHSNTFSHGEASEASEELQQLMARLLKHGQLDVASEQGNGRGNIRAIGRGFYVRLWQAMKIPFLGDLGKGRSSGMAGQELGKWL